MHKKASTATIIKASFAGTTRRVNAILHRSNLTAKFKKFPIGHLIAKKNP